MGKHLFFNRNTIRKIVEQLEKKNLIYYEDDIYFLEQSCEEEMKKMMPQNERYFTIHYDYRRKLRMSITEYCFLYLCFSFSRYKPAKFYHNKWESLLNIPTSTIYFIMSKLIEKNLIEKTNGNHIIINASIKTKFNSLNKNIQHL